MVRNILKTMNSTRTYANRIYKIIINQKTKKMEYIVVFGCVIAALIIFGITQELKP